MSDIGLKVFQTLATMNEQERRAYSIGLSNAYQDIFNTFADAFTRGQADPHAVFMRLSADWEDVRNQQIIEGLL